MTEYIAEYLTARGMKRSCIVPERSAASQLVDELAREWVEVAKINPTAVGTLRVGIFRLASHMTKQIGFDPSRHSIRELRRRHIDSWELTLLEWQAKLGSDHPYRVAVYLFALLRYLEDRRPGRLHPEVYARVCEPTRLVHTDCPNAVLHGAHLPIWERQLARHDRALDAPNLHPKLEANLRHGRAKIVGEIRALRPPEVLEELE